MFDLNGEPTWGFNEKPFRFAIFIEKGGNTLCYVHAKKKAREWLNML